MKTKLMLAGFLCLASVQGLSANEKATVYRRCLNALTPTTWGTKTKVVASVALISALAYGIWHYKTADAKKISR